MTDITSWPQRPVSPVYMHQLQLCNYHYRYAKYQFALKGTNL